MHWQRMNFIEAPQKDTFNLKKLSLVFRVLHSFYISRNICISLPIMSFKIYSTELFPLAKNAACGLV